MDSFPHITVEQTRYPTVIVGGDRFTGLFGKPRNAHLEAVITTPGYISRIFDACYRLGFRGYDVSMSEQVIQCFRQLKMAYPDGIGICNPNWNCGIMLDGIPLREAAPRIKAYLATRVFSAREQESHCPTGPGMSGSLVYSPHRSHSPQSSCMRDTPAPKNPHIRNRLNKPPSFLTGRG